MSATPPVSLDELRKYPRMTRWFNPLLLARLLLKVVVSDMFGQYADRRLMVAALDAVPEEELFERTRLDLPRDAEGNLWVDYVADLGDGFDATYAIATLLARETLPTGGEETRRGSLLVMGGDEVYPLASRENYRRRLRDPYDWAFPDPAPDSDEGPLVYAIPGNHDWYDGLVQFLALFSRKERLHLGAWRSRQRRSYFALQLTEKWWIWCSDTQLGDEIDQPQKEYFMAMAARMPEGSNVILCGPEPGWLYLQERDDARAALDYLGWLARNADRGHRIAVVLSGDTHHYSRYSGDDGTQFITSGGGGAFLHPTHQLKDEIEMEWIGRKAKLSLKTDPGAGHAPRDAEACYPSRKQSRKLLSGNLLFPVTNWDFALLIGGVYFLLSFALANAQGPSAYILVLIGLCCGILGYFGYQEGWKRPRIHVASFLHGCAHMLALLAVTEAFSAVNARLGVAGFWHLAFARAVEIVPAGGAAGGLVFGIYLLVACRWLDMSHNDAFSAMRLNGYRHFLRLRIAPDGRLTIFPIGLAEVPRRGDWVATPSRKPGLPGNPAYRPLADLEPALVERPIEAG